MRRGQRPLADAGSGLTNPSHPGSYITGTRLASNHSARRLVENRVFLSKRHLRREERTCVCAAPDPRQPALTRHRRQLHFAHRLRESAPWVTTSEDEPVYFEWAADGAIGRVLHPRDADLPTLNVKRGILSALQHSLAPPPTHAPGTETWEVDEEDVYGAGTPEQTVPTPFESRRAATTPSSPDRIARFGRTRLQSITIQAPRSTWIREHCFRPSHSHHIHGRC